MSSVAASLRAYLRPGSPAKEKQAPLRQSAPPADGPLSADSSAADGGWGLGALVRGSPRPPSNEPNPPTSNSGAGNKSPMAFRARRFNNSNGASDSDSPQAAAPPAAASGSPEHVRRRSGTENPAAASSPGALQATGPPPLNRQLSSSSSGSNRPSTSPAGTILAAYANGPGANPGISSNASSTGGARALAAGPGSGNSRPRSSGTGAVEGQAPSSAAAAPAAAGGGTGTGAANGGTGAAAGTPANAANKVPRNRLSEEGGHAAGSPTLSLREKVVILQRNVKALEQQLADAASEAQTRAAAAAEAHGTALAELQAKLAAAEQHVATQSKTAEQLTQRNARLAAQLAEAKKAATAAAAAAAAAKEAGAAAAGSSSSPTTTPTKQQPAGPAGSPAQPGTPSAPHPPPLARDKSAADLHSGGGNGGSGGGGSDGPQSPRTPMGWDGLSSGSPSSSSSSSSGSGPAAAAATAATAAASLSPSPGAATISSTGSGSIKQRIAEDTPPAHPHIRPTSPTDDIAPPASGAAPGARAAAIAAGRPHTPPHSAYLRSPASTGTGSDPDAGGPPESTSLIVFSRSDPDGGAALLDGRSSGGSGGALSVAHAQLLHAAGGVGDLFLAGSGPPPASPAAAAAGLSGAGVALLARQKKIIATLRAQLQQKDSAYAFLANEHSELEGQLKEVEAAKREYAARYAFMVLDQDLDGHIRVDQVSSFDMFGCYSTAVLEYAFKHWRFASGFKGYLNMDDFVRFVNLSDDRGSKDSQRFWFSVLDLDGDGAVSAEDAKWFYDAVEKDESAFVVGFEDLWHQLLDMTQPARPRRGFTASELWKCKLGAGVVGLLLNHNNMLLHRTTAEWGRGDFPL